MKPVIFAAALLVAHSAAAFPEWIPVTESEHHMIYVDYSSIRPSGNNWEVWQLFDAHEVNRIAGRSFMSIKGRYEYNCREQTVRVLYRTFHPQRMGSGDALHALADGGSWQSVVEDSVGARVLRMICRKP